jgi:hypothetical protein
MRRLAVFVLGAFTAPACGNGSSSGALGQAHASADCPSTDVACIAQGLDGPIAVGAAVPVKITLEFQGAATPPLHLVATHPDIFAVDGQTVRGKGPGSATLLIVQIGTDAVLDFLHVWVAAPDRLVLGVVSPEGIDLGDSPTSVELLAGDAFTLTPRLFARNQPLLGSAATAWAVDSDAVTLLREVTAAGERVRLIARQPGNATVTATQGALAATLAVEVKP